MYRTGRRWIAAGGATLQPEPLQKSSSSWITECHVCIVIFIVLISVAGILTTFFLLADQAFGQVPHYYVAIDHVTGLDRVTELGPRQAFAPDFNITLRVNSWGAWATVCAQPRMYARVSYRGFSLAATATLTRQICAPPMEAVERHLLARGAGVVVPGSLLDSLSIDIRSGVPQFDIELHGPGPTKMALS